MRSIGFGWLLLSLAVAGCGSADDFGPCSADRDCEAGAACAEGYCISDPLPRIVLVADRPAARVGDMVRIDGAASILPGAAVLEFAVEPEDGARIVRAPENLRVVEVQLLAAHVPVVVTATAYSAFGRTSSSSLTIEPVNSIPRVSLRATASRFEPGDRVELEADASDADGDTLSLSWTLLSGPGALEAAGTRAWLRTDRSHLGRYTVRVDAEDGNGGTTYATLSLEPSDAAPVLEPGAPVEVDHVCDGDPLECRAVARLAPTLHATAPVSVSWRLLDGGDAITAIFDPPSEVNTTVTLRCEPACPIAGDYRLELTVSDPQRREATAVVEVRVGNRPPVLRIHDGTGLPHEFVEHGADGAARYRIFRAAGAYVAWHDPDGDLPDPASIAWSASDESLLFDDPNDLDTGFVAVGAAPALQSLVVSLVAADWNGAGAAASGLLPLLNRPPNVRFDHDLSEGHSYVDHWETPYRKRIFPAHFEASDDDGDPLRIEFSLAQPARAGLRVIGSGREALIGGPASVVGFDHEVIVTVRDDWGATVSATAQVRLTNRLPVVHVLPEDQVFTLPSTGSDPVECCDPGSRGCTYGAIARLPFGPPSTPLPATPRFHVEDPDGDPVDVRIANAQSLSSKVTIAVGGGWRELTSEILCTVRGPGFCDASLRMSGRLTTAAGTRCDYDSTTLRNSFAYIHATAIDSLGDEGETARVRMETR